MRELRDEVGRCAERWTKIVGTPAGKLSKALAASIDLVFEFGLGRKGIQLQMIVAVIADQMAGTFELAEHAAIGIIDVAAYEEEHGASVMLLQRRHDLLI